MGLSAGSGLGALGSGLASRSVERQVRHVENGNTSCSSPLDSVREWSDCCAVLCLSVSCFAPERPERMCFWVFVWSR